MGWFDNAKALCVSAAKAAQVPACPPQPWRRRKPFLFIKNGDKPQARQIDFNLHFLCQQKTTKFPNGVVRQRKSVVRERSEGNSDCRETGFLLSSYSI